MIDYACPSCGANMQSPASMAGMTERCPNCGASIPLPILWPVPTLREAGEQATGAPSPPTAKSNFVVVRGEAGDITLDMSVVGGIGTNPKILRALAEATAALVKAGVLIFAEGIQGLYLNLKEAYGAVKAREILMACGVGRAVGGGEIAGRYAQYAATTRLRSRGRHLSIIVDCPSCQESAPQAWPKAQVEFWDHTGSPRLANDCAEPGPARAATADCSGNPSLPSPSCLMSSLSRIVPGSNAAERTAVTPPSGTGCDSSSGMCSSSPPGRIGD